VFFIFFFAVCNNLLNATNIIMGWMRKNGDDEFFVGQIRRKSRESL